ncbi:coiled-coil domain-containing protein 15 isoform X1 [Patella vulgata]|uniref:coiled-coil domain-containing protein 15 isoform X1 n=2 Tax=Patella vulgata TaxID=6465 RepID=UPI00217F425E|nr:coiled-coil domain-containing protein 15 isoform X1 [Patella vulgata]
MASKLKYDSLPVGLKKISRPVISSDIMGNRNVEIRPVGAWVQPAAVGGYTREPNAIASAREEEERISNIQREKQKRIRQFHEDVKRRVKTMDRIRKQQEMDQNIQDLEEERLIFRHSVQMGNKTVKGNKKTNCSVRKNDDHSIQQAIGGNKSRKGSSRLKKNDELTDLIFTDQTNQIRQFTSEARRKLGGKKTLEEEDEITGCSRRKTRDPSPQRPLRDTLGLTILTKDHRQIPDIGWDEEINEGEEENLQDGDDQEDVIETRQIKSVHFKTSPEYQIENTFTQPVHRSRVKPSVKVPCIYNGVIKEEEKRRKKCHQAMYRKMFMDVEREQVKENIRKREHKKKIHLLKKEKELERKEEEEQALRLVEPRDPVTGETTAETMLRDRLEETQIKDTIEQHEQQRRKIKETERYLEALQHNLRRKIEKKGIILPPLCCCAETAWDTNPDTCANNCVFYKNPKAYAKALHSLLVSCQVV